MNSYVQSQLQYMQGLLHALSGKIIAIEQKIEKLATKDYVCVIVKDMIQKQSSSTSSTSSPSTA